MIDKRDHTERCKSAIIHLMCDHAEKISGGSIKSLAEEPWIHGFKSVNFRGTFTIIRSQRIITNYHKSEHFDCKQNYKDQYVWTHW